MCDLHGLRSLNAIYVNCAWVGILCTCCDPLKKGGIYDDNIVVVVPLQGQSHTHSMHKYEYDVSMVSIERLVLICTFTHYYACIFLTMIILLCCERFSHTLMILKDERTFPPKESMSLYNICWF